LREYGICFDTIGGLGFKRCEGGSNNGRIGPNWSFATTFGGGVLGCFGEDFGTAQRFVLGNI
jgi:hypothetical protein